MKVNKTVKKIAFFWILFHLIGYASFLTGITPKITMEHSGDDYYAYGKKYIFLITPDYDKFNTCSNWELKHKSDEFWPFHKWSYGCGFGYKRSGTTGFPGLWGYYSHDEFLFYVVLPLLIFGLIFLYRKFLT